jgi:hypothetical protein
MTDTVNHPPHYNQGGPIGEDGTAQFEVIKIIDDLGWGFAFCMGNALKYVLRAPHKGTEADDLKKAQWYLRRAGHYQEPTTRVVPQRTVNIDEATKAWELTYDKAALAVAVEAISDGDSVRALTFIARYEAKT